MKFLKKLVLIAVIVIAVIMVTQSKNNKTSSRQVPTFDPGVLSTVSERKTEGHVSLREALENK